MCLTAWLHTTRRNVWNGKEEKEWRMDGKMKKETEKAKATRHASFILCCQTAILSRNDFVNETSHELKVDSSQETSSLSGTWHWLQFFTSWSWNKKEEEGPVQITQVFSSHFQGAQKCIIFKKHWAIERISSLWGKRKSTRQQRIKLDHHLFHFFKKSDRKLSPFKIYEWWSLYSQCQCFSWREDEKCFLTGKCKWSKKNEHWWWWEEQENKGKMFLHEKTTGKWKPN